MKIIIAGGRNYFPSSEEITVAVAKSGFKITELVSGNAQGVDTAAEKWAQSHNIPMTLFPALWVKHGKKAGPLRNAEMGLYAEGLIAFPGGTGTQNMIANMKRLKKLIYIVEI